jgi:hypothetical protein
MRQRMPSGNFFPVKSGIICRSFLLICKEKLIFKEFESWHHSCNIRSRLRKRGGKNVSEKMDGTSAYFYVDAQCLPK